GALGDLDDVLADEGCAFLRALLGVLDAALPFQHGPARVAVLGELAEDRAEVDLAVAQRTEAAGAIDPALVAAIDTGAAVGTELGVLHVEGADALVIEIDEGEVVQLLQHHVAGGVEDVGARMLVHRIEKTLEGGAVVQVLARMQLETDVHSGVVEGIEDRAPALAQFRKRLLDQPGRTL